MSDNIDTKCPVTKAQHEPRRLGPIYLCDKCGVRVPVPAEDKLAVSAAYGKGYKGGAYEDGEFKAVPVGEFVSAYPAEAMLPRITIRDHADMHALINAMQLARHTLAGTRDEEELKDWRLLGELLEAAQELHADVVVADVSAMVRTALTENQELDQATAEQIAYLRMEVHPFHD